MGRFGTHFLILGWLVCALGAGSLTGCKEETAAEGEACEGAQDCDGALVCAKVKSNSSERVCAKLEDTRDDLGCEPEYAGMTCGLVIKETVDDQTPDAGQ